METPSTTICIYIHYYYRNQWYGDYTIDVENISMTEFLKQGREFPIFFDKACTRQIVPSNTKIHSVFKSGDCVYYMMLRFFQKMIRRILKLVKLS